MGICLASLSQTPLEIPSAQEYRKGASASIVVCSLLVRGPSDEPSPQNAVVKSSLLGWAEPEIARDPVQCLQNGSPPLYIMLQRKMAQSFAGGQGTATAEENGSKLRWGGGGGGEM